MPSYVVVGKTHTRLTLKERDVLDANGHHFTMLDAGDPLRLPVGTILDDLQPSELAAFPDRFQLVEGAPLNLGGKPQRLNPELFTLIRRAHAGEASNDEQAVVGDVVAFCEAHAMGTATVEETDTLAAILQEFGISLFV